MARSLLDDAFAHHVWATLRVIDACADLTPEQLASEAPATFDSIIETLRHIVASEAFELCVVQGEVSPDVETDRLDLPELREMIVASGAGWLELVRKAPDPEAVLREVDPGDGYQRDAPMGLRLAHALHHAGDHRRQVCSALSLLGIEPPRISVWDFGVETGRVVEVYHSIGSRRRT
ncbi:MAG TPA: DinB family protein [Tepidiformaceae bacterium]|nr:DinB family protein [Tepidiformaceae bacterium]